MVTVIKDEIVVVFQNGSYVTELFFEVIWIYELSDLWANLV